jgi:hypothetical protein
MSSTEINYMMNPKSAIQNIIKKQIFPIPQKNYLLKKVLQLVLSKGKAKILTLGGGANLIIWKYLVYNLFSNFNRWLNLIIY